MNQLVEKLVRAAMGILHHDGSEHEAEVQWEQESLRKKFKSILDALARKVVSVDKTDVDKKVAKDKAKRIKSRKKKK